MIDLKRCFIDLPIMSEPGSVSLTENVQVFDQRDAIQKHVENLEKICIFLRKWCFFRQLVFNLKKANLLPRHFEVDLAEFQNQSVFSGFQFEGVRQIVGTPSFCLQFS